MVLVVATSDYRNILDYLEYPYKDLAWIVDTVNVLFAERGDDWLMEIQTLLTKMAEIKTRLDKEANNPQYKSLSIDGEASATMDTSPLQAVRSEWNRAILELVKLTDIKPFCWQAEAYTA
jgi:hypothetical protein